MPALCVARYPESKDPEGSASLIPHMEHFYDNSVQTGMMRDLAIDIEVLGEHCVLLGNQACVIGPMTTHLLTFHLGSGQKQNS